MIFKNKEHIEDSDLIELIKKQIIYYQSGSTSFPAMVSQIDIYISSLNAIEKEFLGPLRKKWDILEEINALALDEGVTKPLSEHVELTDNTLKEILSIVDLIIGVR